MTLIARMSFLCASEPIGRPAKKHNHDAGQHNRIMSLQLKKAIRGDGRVEVEPVRHEASGPGIADTPSRGVDYFSSASVIIIIILIGL